ncbi:helix-turn-helix transcriptional regulator [Roseovarius sp. EGI FJ00037]|uniref:helix-turn-helix transcriptional regulator n=1 Tax=Roseovarius salincola TaxID=2978479 RepID=UPI0022A897A6|nr:helix-turn-helix transcriptional regulator [Roseovarius sp. EGI FJ00037]MCZ0811825.1 helix-turn-helix transcriptional regulator [Roseovarius sp. EGI FJ00037]
MGHIHPNKLKFLRERRNLSQAQLADASDVSQKQISRLEQSNDNDTLNTCQGKTLQNLASALNVSADELSTPPEGDFEKRAEALGLKRASFYLSEQDRLNYRFLEARYGVKAHDILRAAPLLFLVTAEMSLAERRERLAELEDALWRVPEDFHSHLGDVRIGLGRVEEAGRAEAQSIEKRDLSGSTITDDEWSDWYKGSGDLFVDFLDRKARELSPDAMGERDEVSGNFSSLRVSIFDTTLDELSAGNSLARLALESGDVHPRDIPKELSADDQSGARARWLEEHCSEETKKAHERRLTELGSINIPD